MRPLTAAVILALVATLSPLLGACGETPEVRKHKALARGQAHLAAGKYSEGIIEMQNALQVDGALVPALHGLGRAYAAKFFAFDAVRELGRARRLAPNDLDIAVDYGRALLEIGAWTEADEVAKAIAARDPASVHATYIRAFVLLGLRKPSEALQWLDARATGSTTAELSAVRAEALLMLGQVDQAEQAFRAALRANPDDARSLAGLGTVSLGRRDFQEAVRLYARAKEVRPEMPRARLWLAVASAWLGKMDEAIRELEGVELRARSPEIIVALSIYYLQSNQPAEAIAQLAPLVRQLPQLAPARLLLAGAYLAANDAEQAVVELSALERQAPDDPMVQLRLATADNQRGLPKQALGRLDAGAKALDRAAEFHLERAHALSMLGRTDEALAAAARAQALAPSAPQPFLVLGQALARQGNVRAAREMFARASAADARFGSGHVATGRLDLVEGDTQAALQAFEAALRADPHSFGAVQAKVLTLVQQGQAKEAIQFLEASSNDNPRSAAIHALLGSVYLREGQTRRAHELFRRAIEMDSRSIDARLGLARIALNAGSDEEAVAQLQAVLDLQPDHSMAVLLLSALHGTHGRPDLAVTVLEAAVKASPRDPNFALLLGDLYLKTARHDEAIELMSRLLERSPDVVVARLVRGQALLAKGSAQAGLKEMNEVAKAQPRSPEVQHVLARAYAGLGRMDEARRAYREALRLNPGLDLARIELASLESAGRDEAARAQALTQLDATIRRDPKNVALREARARALFLGGDTPGAYIELTRILELAPLHLGANLMAARLLVQQGRPQEATRHLELVLRVNPSHPESHALLARQLQRQGNLPAAIEHLELAVKADSGLADAQLDLGGLYVSVGRIDDALSLAQQLARAAPASPGPHVLRGGALLEQRDYRGASEAYAAALKLDATLATADRGLGQAQAGLGQPAGAIESYQRALAIDGADLVTLNNLAWLLLEVRKRPEEALPLAAKAVEIAPRSGEALDTLGWVHYRRGAYAQSEKVLASAVERLPNNAVVHYHLGMTYYRLGKKTEALYTLRRASQLDPALARAENLAVLMRDLGG